MNRFQLQAVPDLLEARSNSLKNNCTCECQTVSHNLTDREIFNKISEVDVVIHLAGKAHNIKT